MASQVIVVLAAVGLTVSVPAGLSQVRSADSFPVQKLVTKDDTTKQDGACPVTASKQQPVQGQAGQDKTNKNDKNVCGVILTGAEAGALHAGGGGGLGTAAAVAGVAGAVGAAVAATQSKPHTP